MTEEKVIVKNKVHVLSNVKELEIDKSKKPQTHGVFSAEDKEDLPSTNTTSRAGDEDVKHSSCETFTTDGKSKSANKMFSSNNEPSILIIEASVIADKFISLSVSEISTTVDIYHQQMTHRLLNTKTKRSSANYCLLRTKLNYQ